MDNPDTTNVDERVGTDDNPAPNLKTLHEISDNAIQAAPGVSMVPEFPPSASRREVAENTMPGGKVGDPLMAMDPDSTDDLIYSLGGREERYFRIGEDTGQIFVGGETDDGKTDPMLDYEMAPTSYTVEVTATDSQGEKGTVTVTISVIDRNEPPMFSNPMTAINYTENGMEPVHTFQATDPEGMSLHWDVTGTDAGQFTISNGVLKFMDSPDEENPEDISRDDAGNEDISRDDAGNNEYVITVRASEMRAGGYMGPAKSRELDVVVTVTDDNEDGMVTLQWRQPEVATPIMATLMDEDDANVTGAWVWTVSKVAGTPTIDNEEHWEAGTVANGASSATYTPATADAGKFLRVSNTYTIDGTETTARMMSEFRVRADVESADNASPDFTGGETERSVDEDAEVGAKVGDPVVISEPDPDEDTVTYSLEGTGAGTDNNGDRAYFSIDKITGQITVKQMLDADTDQGRTGDDIEDGKYVVVARVTDPSAAPIASGSNSSDTITVKITANQVNEDPSVVGLAELMVMENANLPAAGADHPATYMATDEDAQTNINWELDGDDADDFRISGTGPRTLMFADMPDYEMPTDANGDNVYEVIVAATDGSGGRGVRMVTVIVTNVEEDGGVTLMPEQPHLGDPVTAKLTDPDIPDDEVTVTWQWMRSTTSSDNPAFENIRGATTATYTPVRRVDEDGQEIGDTGYYLRATAMYRDDTSPEDTPDKMHAAMETSDNAVLATPATSNAPEFASTTMTRMVYENSPSTSVVGPPVMAMDDDAADTLTYELGGSDAGSFTINEDSGQIMVKLGAMLDYEIKRTYTVEVTATDTTMLTDMVTVTIMVTNVNEMPSMPKELFGDLAITGPTSMDYMEGGTAAVGMYTAVGPDAASVAWNLSGDDMGDFNISNMGELTFASVPDYEMPMDMDMDNMYEITVMGNDGTNPAVDYNVIVAVTNMDEMGEVTLWDGMDALTMAPQVGDTITGAVMDPDGGVMVESWQWARTMDPADMASWMDIQEETAAAYEVMASDAGSYLRVTATYTDGEGMGKMASEETMMVGAEAGGPAAC